MFFYIYAYLVVSFTLFNTALQSCNEYIGWLGGWFILDHFEHR